MENGGNYGKNQHKSMKDNKKIGEVYMEGIRGGLYDKSIGLHLGKREIECTLRKGKVA